MANTVQPYLFFRGRCEEAIEYYKSTLGADVKMLMRFRDNPDQPPPGAMPAEFADRVMHAEIRVAGVDILMSDGMNSGPLDFTCMSLALSVDNPAEVDRLCNALAAEGKMQMPISPTFFAERFGSVEDKFGVSWMVITPKAGGVPGGSQ
ncbi:MAG: VOC family protein [Alphaproteobacteria bacterium]|nr:VOC family protein [Alphaproteobacteria bacterium]